MRRGDMTVSPSGSKFTGRWSRKSWIFCGVPSRANSRRSAGVKRSFSAFGGIDSSLAAFVTCLPRSLDAGHAGPAFSTEPVPQERRSPAGWAEGRYLLIFRHLLPVRGAGFYLEGPKTVGVPRHDRFPLRTARPRAAAVGRKLADRHRLGAGGTDRHRRPAARAAGVIMSSFALPKTAPFSEEDVDLLNRVVGPA